jgi:uncharacterized membrane protein HdeD (DUF308 family)
MTTERSGENNKSVWKSLIGGVIVCAAFAIMMPDLIKYLFSISRLLVLVALIFVAAGVIGVISTRKLREKIRAAQPTGASDSASEAEPSEETH